MSPARGSLFKTFTPKPASFCSCHASAAWAPGVCPGEGSKCAHPRARRGPHRELEQEPGRKVWEGVRASQEAGDDRPAQPREERPGNIPPAGQRCLETGAGRGEAGRHLRECRKAICLARGTPQWGRARADAHLQDWGAPALGRYIVHLGRQRWQRGLSRSGNREEGLGETEKSQGKETSLQSPQIMFQVTLIQQRQPQQHRGHVPAPLTRGPSLRPRTLDVGGEAPWWWAVCLPWGTG